MSTLSSNLKSFPSNDEDDPRNSSAAQSIVLKILNHRFAPEYTHQCFDNEWIPGYQPYHLNDNYHESHKYHSGCNFELEVEITFSPSCDICSVEINTRRKHESMVDTRNPKKLRETHSTDENNKQRGDVDLPVDDLEKDNIIKTVPDGTPHSNDNDTAESATITPMPPEEIKERLKHALPKILPMNNGTKDLLENCYLEKTVGKVLKTYTRGTSHDCDKQREFVLTVADGDDAAEYHKLVQNIAIFFIESADAVDFADTQSGGYWKALYLFQKHDDSKFSLCGYMTLFHFLSPFRKPLPGTVIRICQALVLPPYQREGHGKVMVHAVHEMARNSAGEIVEINVEDPAPSFASLRNCVDCELLEQSLHSPQPWIGENYLKIGEFPALLEPDAIEAASLGRITINQLHTAYELYKLKSLPENDPEIEKQYRLMVKRRLLKVHKEDLSGCETKEERKILLDEIWAELFEKYKLVLKKK